MNTFYLLVTTYYFPHLPTGNYLVGRWLQNSKEAASRGARPFNDPRTTAKAIVYAAIIQTMSSFVTFLCNHFEI